jgi:anti-sigma B factor antagonist
MQTETINDILVIAMPERLDAAGVADIEPAIAEQLAEYTGKVLIDMARVNFIASLALRLLLTHLKAVQQVGGDLRLCGLQPQIAEVFRKSRFDTLFKISTDRDSAIASYEG